MKRKQTSRAASRKHKYVLRLYITGVTPNSRRAVSNIKKICEEYLEGRYNLEVVDIYQQPSLAKGEQIVAAPTLVKRLPLPLRRLIGDMSDKQRTLLGLDLRVDQNGRNDKTHHEAKTTSAKPASSSRK